jgi:hypothetical protein
LVLTEAKNKNLARFHKKFSRENRNVEVFQGDDGVATFKNEVPGRVPGSKAVYEKTVDAFGNTTSATKTKLPARSPDSGALDCRPAVIQTGTWPRSAT